MSPDVVGWAMLAIAIALPATIVFSLGRRFERWQAHRRRRAVIGIAKHDAGPGELVELDLGSGFPRTRQRRRGA